MIVNDLNNCDLIKKCVFVKWVYLFILLMKSQEKMYIENAIRCKALNINFYID